MVHTAVICLSGLVHLMDRSIPWTGWDALVSGLGIQTQVGLVSWSIDWSPVPSTGWNAQGSCPLRLRDGLIHATRVAWVHSMQGSSE